MWTNFWLGMITFNLTVISAALAQIAWPDGIAL